MWSDVRFPEWLMVVKVLVVFREFFKASISVLAASGGRLLSVSSFRAKRQKTFGEQKGQSDDCLVTNSVEHTGYGHRRERGHELDRVS